MDITKLAAPTRGPVRNRSIFDDWLDQLPAKEREAVTAAVIDRAWGHTALLDILVSEGAPRTAATSFQNWRHKMGLPR
ncbi:hypothetical protein NS183_07835 [Microbacterium testaceum]|uniref:hypothetical protein n=1 Tax=Microbacterium testaceum TaxID=2033 RepID=UPI000733C89B|nr:hypothetical protein [Microbacterium testaceum]KTS90684.1 hypothetical protein NS183_07835 [Microbacterium testaceum]